MQAPSFWVTAAQRSVSSGSKPSAGPTVIRGGPSSLTVQSPGRSGTRLCPATPLHAVGTPFHERASESLRGPGGGKVATACGARLLVPQPGALRDRGGRGRLHGTGQQGKAGMSPGDRTGFSKATLEGSSSPREGLAGERCALPLRCGGPALLGRRLSRWLSPGCHRKAAPADAFCTSGFVLPLPTGPAWQWRDGSGPGAARCRVHGSV